MSHEAAPAVAARPASIDTGSPCIGDAPNAEALNEACRCEGVDLATLRGEVEEGLDADRLPGSLVETHPHLFSALPVYIRREHAERMAAVTAALETVVALPAYREAVLAYAPEIARHDPGARGVFAGLDFHLSDAGPKLIEINTNAGGALLAAMLAEAQRACCDEVRAVVHGGQSLAALERRLWAMFIAEWRAAGRTGAPRTVAIVDDDPPGQYLYPEFLLFTRLFERFGVRAFVADPAALENRDGVLYLGLEPLDLVYNRLTDFALEAPGHATLRAAYLNGAAVVTPHPQAHALLADKRNLVLLGDEAALRSFGASGAAIETLAGAVPRTEIVRAGRRRAPMGRPQAPLLQALCRLREPRRVPRRQADAARVRGDPRRRVRGAVARATARAHRGQRRRRTAQVRRAQLRLRGGGAASRRPPVAGPDDQLPLSRRRVRTDLRASLTARPRASAPSIEAASAWPPARPPPDSRASAGRRAPRRCLSRSRARALSRPSPGSGTHPGGRTARRLFRAPTAEFPGLHPGS